MDLGGRIRKARARLGHTQEQAAKAMGVRKNTVARWERGERSPLPGIYRAAAEAYVASAK